MVYSALKEKQKGAPVEVVLPKEGLGQSRSERTY